MKLEMVNLLCHQHQNSGTQKKPRQFIIYDLVLKVIIYKQQHFSQSSNINIEFSKKRFEAYTTAQKNEVFH